MPNLASLQGSELRTITLEKASGTVIAPGAFVTLDAGGLAITAVAASTQLAFTERGAVAGTTTVDVIANKDAVYFVTGAANFAKANRGVSYDMNASQQLNTAATTTTVLKVLPTLDAGTVGSTANIKVTINKHINF